MARQEPVEALSRRRRIVPFLLGAVAVAAQALSGPAVMLAAGYDREPVYRIPLRVHLGGSGRSPAAFRDILEEINDIWLSQAGICFAMQVSMDDENLGEGMDLWFMPELEEGWEMNGAYRNDHDIRVRDRPNLGPADHPARHPAARTAAHELGHGLGLPHRQDSDDNLMRSRTYGRQLSREEVRQAREKAKVMALPDRAVRTCGTGKGRALSDTDERR